MDIKINPNIDPRSITNYERSERELLEFLMFSMAVAGKRALPMAVKFTMFLHECRGSDVFEPRNEFTGRLSTRYLNQNYQRNVRIVKNALYNRMIGKYTTLIRGYCEQLLFPTSFTFFKEVVDLGKYNRGVADICTPERLEQVTGVGPKTARFFLVHSSENARYAVLDTHILKFLKELYPEKDIPKSTPTSKKKYRELEYLFLREYDRHATVSGASLAEFDLNLWRHYSKE